MDRPVPLPVVLDAFTLPTNADDDPSPSNPMATLSAISEIVEYSRSLRTRICELI
jgi:hypothetical protein